MQEKGLEFHYYPMDNQEDVLNQIKNSYDHKTVPLIVVNIDGNERLIGGYDDLVEYIKQQENKKCNQ